MTKKGVLLCKIHKKYSRNLSYVYIEPKMAIFTKKAFFVHSALTKKLRNPIF